MNAFEVYALNYAGPVTGNGAFVHWLSDWDQQVERGYFYWLLQGAGMNILVDCGCRPDQADDWVLPNYLPPDEMLANAGLSVGDINHLVLTHLHWDHAGAAELFTSAETWVHADELAFWLDDPVAGRGPFKLVSDRRCLDYLGGLRQRGGLKTTGRDREILPGVEAVAAPGHTPGLMTVAVDTAKGRAVIGSDSGHLFRNFEEEWPSSLISDLPAWLKSFEKLKKMTEPGMVFPGHDMLMATDYERVAPRVTRLA